jgi:two-component system, NtrC family, response regulator AlgB
VLARAQHASSPRRACPLVTVDCRALHGGALASAHVVIDKVHEAVGGTVLFDEIGALTRPIQAGVASLLEQDRVAGHVATRVIATSQRDLEAAVQAGSFSEDLLARLAVVEIRVPPLRERREDILPLAQRFLGAFARGIGITDPELTARAQRALLEYGWPGNVRELRNAMQRAVILTRSAIVDVDALPPRLGARPR